MKFVHILASILAFASASAMAQFSIHQGSSDADTMVSIKPTGSGAAELTFSRVKAVYLNKDPKIAGIKSQKDASGKGDVWVVDLKSAPEFAGVDVTFTGVGGGAWAVGTGGRINPDMVKSTKLAEEFMLPVTIDGRGGCAAFTFVPTKNGAVIDMAHLWISHPGNASYLFKNANGQTDMATLLCTDKDGNISAGTPEQAVAYGPTYTANTAVKTAKK